MQPYKNPLPTSLLKADFLCTFSSDGRCATAPFAVRMLFLPALLAGGIVRRMLPGHLSFPFPRGFIETADAYWWLLLRSALRATPSYCPPALLLPLNLWADTVHPFRTFSVRGRGTRIQTEYTMCSGAVITQGRSDRLRFMAGQIVFDCAPASGIAHRGDVPPAA